MKNVKFKIQNWLFTFCILHFAFLIGCSIPNLEKPECSAARQATGEFYSYHFGNDMKPSKENLQLRAKFLTDELKQNLTAQNNGETDYFTATDDYPKAFRIGYCTVINENKTIFEVVLFWKDDARSEQREIKVETINQGYKWLINKVENK